MKAYKAFNRELQCRDFQYKEGEIYEIKEKPVLCEKGFHFVKDLVLSLNYYPVYNDICENKYAEIEVLGDTEFKGPTNHKGVTNKIKIVRVIPDDEVRGMVDGDSNSGGWNSGNWNSGDWNSGNWNSGNSNSGHSNSGNWNSGNSNSGHSNSGRWNSGNWNSGDWNSGNWNSGNWNSGNWNSGNSNSGRWNSCNEESGFFNSEPPDTVRVFNKPCSLMDWNSAIKPDFLFFEVDPDLGYKKSFQKAFKGASKKDVKLLKSLPNFDEDVFYEISGIQINEQ